MTNLVFGKGKAYLVVSHMGKNPTGKGWNLRENAITDESDAWQFEGKNVALALAYCEPRVVHMDVDDYPLALQELAKHSIDLRKILEETTCVFHSGRKNSISALFYLPKEAPLLKTRTLQVDGKTVLEFRCGTNDAKTCASVIPDSTHPSGTQYQFLKGHSLDTVQEMPIKLLAFAMSLTNTTTPEKKATQRHIGFDCGYETPRRLALLREQLRYIDPDCDYSTWRDVIWAIMSTGYPSAYSIAREWSEGAPHRYNFTHFFHTANAYQHGHFTAGTVYHYARIGGWNG